MEENKKNNFYRLVEIMEHLLSPEGCPWDREQTHETLKPFLIEEAYEVNESIDRGNYDELKEELGDLILQIVFHSALAKNNGKFDIDDVLNCICEKMIRRHPHVFGKQNWDTPEEVLKNWEELKKYEKTGSPNKRKSILDGVPKNLPSLLKAHRIQDRAARVGFDWKTIEPVWEKVNEEISELQHETINGDKKKIEEEFGDLLFAMVNLSRFLKINPEDALQKTITKFIKRFNYIETESEKEGRRLMDMTLEEMDIYWEKSKEHD